MLAQSKKSFLLSQVFIAAATVTAYFFMGRQWFPTLLIFLVMQVGALMGAAFGSRIKRKAENMPERDDLPLKPR